MGSTSATSMVRIREAISLALMDLAYSASFTLLSQASFCRSFISLFTHATEISGTRPLRPLESESKVFRGGLIQEGNLCVSSQRIRCHGHSLHVFHIITPACVVDLDACVYLCCVLPV